MRAMPRIDEELKTVNSSLNCQIKELLGDGAQGRVYRARYGAKEIAVKWYKPSKASQNQREIIEELISSGPPCERFLWPIDLVIATEVKGFGYIMELKREGYKSISDLVARRVDTTYHALATLGYQLADSYRELHARGYCYRDINFDNIAFNPQTGDIQIYDNDNVGINNQSQASVKGTQRFMAPEVVRDEQMPNTDSDIFSLAVLLFYIFINNHPLHGEKESRIRCFDLPAMRKIYGEEPVFIFAPNDSSNRPKPGEHDNAIISWPIYPEFIKELFTQTFTAGLTDVNKRVREGQWRSAMLRLRDAIFHCAHCGVENFYDPQKMSSNKPGQCWNCQAKLRLPYQIKFDNKKNKLVMLNAERKLYPHHLKRRSKRDFSQVLAEVNRHPDDPRIWGLKNLSGEVWSVVNTKGETKQVEPERSVVLAPGVEIDFGERVGKIIY